MLIARHAIKALAASTRATFCGPRQSLSASINGLRQYSAETPPSPPEEPSTSSEAGIEASQAEPSSSGEEPKVPEEPQEEVDKSLKELFDEDWEEMEAYYRDNPDILTLEDYEFEEENSMEAVTPLVERDLIPDGEFDTEEPVGEIINMAGTNAIGWNIVDVDEEISASYWGVDLTGGKVWGNEYNALLSDEAKWAMYHLHQEDPEEHSVEELARRFKIRQQRVIAILTLKELEVAAEEEAGAPLDQTLREAVELNLFDCVEPYGTGERHIKNMPMYPQFEFQATKPDIPGVEIVNDHGSRGVATEVDAVSEAWAEEEERIAVQAFKNALDYNLKKVGTTLQRESRKGRMPRKPAGGWNLVVVPVGKDEKKAPYVAPPQGSRRPLNDDEKLYLGRIRSQGSRRKA